MLNLIKLLNSEPNICFSYVIYFRNLRHTSIFLQPDGYVKENLLNLLPKKFEDFILSLKDFIANPTRYRPFYESIEI